MGTRVLGRNQAFATVTAYQAVPPGTPTVRAAGGSASTIRSIKLSAGAIHTCLVLDGGLLTTGIMDRIGRRVSCA